ncbi:MAG: site-2 protease family protein [Acidobacteriia bacterium]|nr:site-2 protease family protein [Terriglobia bacterium]
MSNTDSRVSGTLSAVRLFGVPVRFHFTFVLLLIFLITAGVGGGRSVLLDALFLLTLFVSVLLHELGHALVARLYGIRTLEIVMYPIGGVARLERMAGHKAELWIALAGPAVNVAIAAALVALMMGLTPASPESDMLERIATSNIYLAVFNMMPAFPMDGGRVLRALLAIWKGEEQATRVASYVGRLMAMGMGVYGLATGKIFLMLIAFLIYSAASQEGAASAGRALTHGIAARAAMVTEFETLPHGSTMKDAADRLLATTQQDFPVVHGDSVIGLLDRTAFLRGMAGDGADSYVSGVMDRDFVRIDPGMDLAEALPLMTGNTACALVMDGEKLLGLLTRENVGEFLLLRRMGMQLDQRGRE